MCVSPDPSPSLAPNPVSCFPGADHDEPGPSGQQAPATASTDPGNMSSEESSEGIGEGTSEAGTVKPSACTSQATIAETHTSEGPVSVEASGSLSGEHDTAAVVHRVEEGTSEATGMRGLAGGEDPAGPRPHAGPLRSLLPQLLEMQRQSQGMQEGLTATLDRLRGC